MISRSSSFASSTPATSAKLILLCFSEMRRARAFPNESALAPPPCIWRMKKIHTPMKRTIGNHEMRSDMYQGLGSRGFTLMRTPLSRRLFTKSGESTT